MGVCSGSCVAQLGVPCIALCDKVTEMLEKKNGISCQIPAMICSFYSAFSEEALWQADLSGRPLHALPLDPNLAVTLAILGAPTVTSQAPAFFRDQVSEPLCACHELVGAVQVVFSARWSLIRSLSLTAVINWSEWYSARLTCWETHCVSFPVHSVHFECQPWVKYT